MSDDPHPNHSPCSVCGQRYDSHIDRHDARPGQCDTWTFAARLATPAPAIPDEGEALAACPCCGSGQIIPPPKHWPEGCAYCRNCGLRANSLIAWNTRAPSAEIARLTAALGEAHAVIVNVPVSAMVDRLGWTSHREALAGLRAAATLARIRPAGGPSHE